MRILLLSGLLLGIVMLAVDSGQAADKSEQPPKKADVAATEPSGQAGPPEAIPKISPAAGEYIEREVISAGGTDATSTNYSLSGTMAQTATGGGTSTSYSVGHGFWSSGAAGPNYLCGDADGNVIINIADAVYLISYIFGGGPAPAPIDAGDADCNSFVNIADAVYLIAYIFGGGPAPCAGCP